MNSAPDDPVNVAKRVMCIYDEHVPGSREAYLNDQVTYYARGMMRHVLAIAEIAMVTEEIPEDVRFRILMMMAVGQPSTPVDAEHRREITKQLLAAQGVGRTPDWASPLLRPPPGVVRCTTCSDRGYVPDFSRGLDAEFGEPGKKPCPDCQGAVARDEPERTLNSESTWTCACRYMNSGPICTHCGALKPEPERG